MVLNPSNCIHFYHLKSLKKKKHTEQGEQALAIICSSNPAGRGAACRTVGAVRPADRTATCKPTVHTIIREPSAGRADGRGFTCATALQGLQSLHHITHEGPCLGVLAKAIVCQAASLLCGPHWVLILQSGVNDLQKLSLVIELGPGPVDQALLLGRSGLVHRPPACQQLQKDYTKAVDITLGSQVTWSFEYKRVQ